MCLLGFIFGVGIFFVFVLWFGDVLYVFVCFVDVLFDGVDGLLVVDVVVCFVDRLGFVFNDFWVGVYG